MDNTVSVLNPSETANALPYPALVLALEKAAQEYLEQRIEAPTRQALSYPEGGTLLSMPATARDIGIHKLVNVMPGNAARNLPTILGLVCVYDGSTGHPLFILDGPTVTMRRTAAVSMLGIRLLWGDQCRHVAIVGAGVQAEGHAQAVHALYPDSRISIVARSPEKAARLHTAVPGAPLHIVRSVPEEADVVITVTSSASPVYALPARPERLLIGVGAYRGDMAEYAPETVAASRLYIDDWSAGQHEAGDLIQAGADWNLVHPIARAIQSPPDRRQAMLYKTVGSAAWDLAAARCARINVPPSTGAASGRTAP